MLRRKILKPIYQTEDSLGKIRVFENVLERVLVFNSTSKQSAVLKNNYQISTLKYQHVMQLVTLFDLQYDKILILGLGGGAMANFFQKQSPQSLIEVIEVRPKVFQVAKNFFGFRQNNNLKLIIGDGATELAKMPDNKYDLILLDTFVDEGMPESINNSAFFANCKKKLTKQGILTINYWTSQYMQRRNNLDFLLELFNNQIIKSTVESCSNIIYYLFNDATHKQNLTFKNQKEVLMTQKKYQAPYIRYLKTLLMENNLEYANKLKW